MSSVSSTFGSLLGTVTKSASAITGIAHTAVLGVDMLNARVEEAHASQRELLILESANRTNRVVEKYARAEVTRREELTQWLGSDKARAKAYEEAKAELLKKLQPAAE